MRFSFRQFCRRVRNRRVPPGLDRMRGTFLILSSVVAVLTAGYVAAAGSVARPWADRPPTLDPSYGLPIPAAAAAARKGVGPPSWIWAAQTRNNQIIYLRRSFTLTTVPRRALLYATADDHLELFLNGHLVTSTFQKHHEVWRRVRKISVAGFLHPGINVIAVRAENIAAAAGVLVALIGDQQPLCDTNGGWRVAYSVPAGPTWTSRSFDDSHWPHATVETPYGGGPWGQVHPWMSAGYLAHLYFQPLHVTVLHGRADFQGLKSVPAALTPEDIVAIRPDYAGRSLLAPAHEIHLVVTPSGTKRHPELLLSFGQEVAGRIQVRGSGGTVLIGTGESRGEALHGPWGGVHKLDLAGGQTQSTPYSAFRYATVSFSGPGPMTLNRLRLDFKYYPVTYRGAFACSDPLLTKIWYTGAYTAHLCMQEQIWDAPKRDRAMWMGDLQISGQVINNVFLDRFLMELTMRDLRQSAQHGRPATALPARYINNTAWGGIPGYSNAWFCGLSDFYKHTGAIHFVRSQHQLLLSMLRYVKQGFNRKNIFVNKNKGWCFVDWADHLAPPGTLGGSTPQTLAATDLYTCWAVRRAVFLLQAMGNKVHAAKYARWDRQITLAARKYLANPQTHTYTNLRQVNAMAVISGVADTAQRAAIFSRILGPTCPAWKQIATPYYNNFVIFALSRLGRTQQALNFIRYYWGGMMARGATTFWETYNPLWPKRHFAGYAMSRCHGWSAGVTSWLTECVLGVQPKSGGFGQTTITPHLGGLTWVRGRVPTPHGNIALRVVKTSTAESITLTLPQGIHALVGVVGRSVTVNGSPVKPVRRGHTRSYLNLTQPGIYRITGN